MQSDTHWLQRCLQIAAKASTHCNPNPAVGAVIVSADGSTLLGEGFTQPVGQPHAEIMALRDATAHGHDVRGATLYVSLEPCSHHGRTPPCADAIVRAGIARVLACTQDPNPLVAGNGFARLQEAGIVTTHGFFEQQAQELNIGFFKRMRSGIPWLRLKTAASIDGFTALPSGESQWITGETARQDGHNWRARACVILTGIGTVLADNPKLNVRTASASRQPHIAIADSQLRTPVNCQLLHTDSLQQRSVLIYTTDNTLHRSAEKAEQLRQAGAQLIVVAPPDHSINHSTNHCTAPATAAPHKTTANNHAQRPSLHAIVKDLAQRLHANEIHIEAGAALSGNLLQHRLVDEWLYYFAPRLLLAGKPIADIPPHKQPSNLSQTLDWKLLSSQQLGDDCRLLLRPHQNTP